jgi:hypothetical protein
MNELMMLLHFLWHILEVVVLVVVGYYIVAGIFAFVVTACVLIGLYYLFKNG